MLDWMDEAHKDKESLTEILAFQDYMDIFEEHPYRECRPSYEYLIGMLNHFGATEDGQFKLFETYHPDSPPVFGQKKPQHALYENLLNFKEEGINNKFILLVGPNGSSKSSLVRKFMRGAEEYSKKDEGALYTFSWIFPIESYVKGSLGLGSQPEGGQLDSFAYLEDKDISAILNSELKDHPALLIPREYRQRIIEDLLKDYPELLDSVKKSYLYKGDLSKRNRMIYDALLKNYKGRHEDVLKHIRVERFTISRRYSSGAVTIEPQVHVDAQMQQITMDKRLASLPPSLQSLNLFSLQGEIVLANRGILEFSDLLKRPLDSYKYLLQTMETGDVNLHGILTQLDIFFLGTSNEVHLAAFKQHPDFNSFKGRFKFVRVPYLLDYKEEEKIYHEQVEGLADKASFEPRSLETLCLFSVMTRLRQPQVKNYDDKKLANIVTNLNPLEKALFIADDQSPDRLDSESIQVLKAGKSTVLEEFEYENLYEGKFGISPRDLKAFIYEVTAEHETITFVEVLDHLQRLIAKKNDYDFLNMTAQGDYHHPARFIDLTRNFCLDQFDSELRDSLGMVDDRSYEDYIKRYILNVNAVIKGEKIKNTVTGNYEDGDEYFINEFEKSINLQEDPHSFRSHLISKLGAYSLDYPGQEFSYMHVFPELVEKLKESFREEQGKVIEAIAKNILYYEAEVNDEDGSSGKTPLSDKNRDLIKKVINNLMKDYGYSHQGALTLIKTIINDRY